MEVKEVQKLIQADENQEVEFKSSAGKVGESICSFANTNNGIILVGVGDKGKITNREYRKLNKISRVTAKRDLADFSRKYDLLNKREKVEEFTTLCKKE